MITQEEVDVFVEEIEKLENCRLVRNLYGEAPVTVTFKGDWSKAIFPGLDEEELRSFLLTARLLIQKNDGISIARISEYFENLTDLDERKRKGSALRWKLNDYLDSPALHPDHKGNTYSNRELVNIFLFGMYAHTRDKHRKTLSEWSEDSKTFNSLKLTFLYNLKFIYEVAVSLKNLSKPAISIPIKWKMVSRNSHVQFNDVVYLYEEDKRPLFWGKALKNQGEAIIRATPYRPQDAFGTHISGLPYSSQIYVGEVPNEYVKYLGDVESHLISFWWGRRNTKSKPSVKYLRLLHEGEIPACILERRNFATSN